jgi:hypothetical protein
VNAVLAMGVRERIVATAERIFFAAGFSRKLGHLARFLQGKVAEISPLFLEDIRLCAGVFSGGGGVSRAGNSPLFRALV